MNIVVLPLKCYFDVSVGVFNCMYLILLLKMYAYFQKTDVNYQSS